ncbi:MAG: alpha/beta hydrolase [Acidimicrobiia bacterium]
MIIQDDLGNIDCPTLIVDGAEDFIVPKAAMLAQRLNPDARLALIPDSSHYPVIEQPGAFTETLRTATNTSQQGPQMAQNPSTPNPVRRSGLVSVRRRIPPRREYSVSDTMNPSYSFHRAE